MCQNYQILLATILPSDIPNLVTEVEWRKAPIVNVLFHVCSRIVRVLNG